MCNECYEFGFKSSEAQTIFCTAACENCKCSTILEWIVVSVVDSGTTGVRLPGLHVGTHYRQLLSNHRSYPWLIWCMSALSLFCCCGETFTSF